MSEPTTENGNDTSTLFGVSIRGWIAVVIVVTVCVISAASAWASIRAGAEVIVGEPLYSMAAMSLGFYFGQKLKP